MASSLWNLTNVFALLLLFLVGQSVTQQSPIRKRNSAKGISVLRPHHTGFTVSSLTDAVNLWKNVLGLPVSDTGHSVDKPMSTLVGVPGANLSALLVTLPGGHQVELVEYTGTPQPKNIYRPESKDVGSVHIALEITGMDEVVRKAKDIGWRALAEPVVIFWPDLRIGLARAVYLRHIKDGITIELFETLVAT
jgi:catechol 2,3-dioxygenase-like lactoylglutathione lyase family enzyme